MKIAISGASGLVGKALVRSLAASGSKHEIVRLVRSDAGGPGTVRWDPDKETIDAASLEGIDALIHLAGENIAGGRWTAALKNRIRESRVKGTRLVARALAAMKRAPKVWISASAIGYYGNRGDEKLTETSAPGSGFLASVCQEWEQSTAAAEGVPGLRIVKLRIGVVLDKGGGALAKMLLPFKLGLGGVIGGGDQYMSWVALDDLVGAIEHCLGNESLSGPINATAPEPETNRQFTRTLGKVLGRPTIFPMPALAARLAFGEMADEMLLGGARVLPARLEASGFRFRHPTIEGALRHILA